MKRHPALIPFSRDHHHALVQARRMRAAAKATPAEQLVQASAFVDFFASETSPHFRDEEELLFPLIAGSGGRGDELLAQLRLEHAELRALDAQLRDQLLAGAVVSTTMRQLGELLERHVHAEERELFPLIERTASEAELVDLEHRRKRRTE